MGKVVFEKVEELSDESFKAILNNMGDPVFVKDSQSRLILVNDAFCRTFGRERADILGKTLAEDVRSEEQHHFLKVDRQVISDGKESIVEEPITIRDGGTRVISTRKTRFVDEEGRKFLVGVIRDITTQKQAEELDGLNRYNEFLLKAAQILSRPNSKYKACLEQLAENVSQFFGAVCDISILNKELGVITPEAVFHPNKEIRDIIVQLFNKRTVTKGQGLVGGVIETGKEALFIDVPEAMRIAPRKVDPRIVPVSMLYVPLQGMNGVVGSLNVTRLEGDSRLTEIQLNRIRRLADYVSLFVENALLKEKEAIEIKRRQLAERQLEQEKRWAEFKLQVSSTLADVDSSLEKILDDFVKQVAAAFDVVCDVQLVDGVTQIINPIAIHHKDRAVKSTIKKLFRKTTFKVGEGMIGKVIACGEEMFVASLPPEILRKTKEQKVDDSILPSSFFYSPLKGHNRILGTLNLTRLHNQKPLTNEDVARIRDLGNHVSRFIENRILQDAQKQEIKRRTKAELKLEKTTNELAQLEADTRMILNAIPIYIARVSKDLRYLFLNEAYKQRGMNPGITEGKRVADVIGSDELMKLMGYVERVMNGNLVNYEYENTMSDGVHRYFNVVLAPDFAPDGSVVGFYSCSIDMTTKVLAQREARITQDRLETLSLNSGDAFFFHDVERHILDVNAVATEMLGYSREEFLTMKADQIDPTWKGDVYQRFLQVLDINSPQTFDTTVFRKDGTEVPVEVRFVKRVEGGQPYIQSLMRDRTDKRDQELKLQRSEERLRLIFDNVEDHIAIINKDGVFESINKAFQGLEVDDIVGRTIFDINDNTDKVEFLRQQFEKLKVSGGRFELTGSSTKADGSKQYYSRKFIGIFYGKQFYKAILIIKDITAERDREYSVMRAVLRGQELERKRLGAELHDGIGQVLSAIALQVSQIREEVSFDGTNAFTDDLTSLNVNLQEAIREVRNISHDLMPEVLESFGLKEAINQTCTNLHDRLGINVMFDHVDLEVRYDQLVEVNLFRIAQELLNNIQKHASCTKVFVSLMDHGESLNLTVEDDGVGFNPESDSNGIGLSNVISRVNSMNGQIDIESAENSGTLINIDVPKKRE